MVPTPARAELSSTSKWIMWLGAALLVALSLAALDAQGDFGVALLAYGALSLMGAGLLALGWRAVGGEGLPRAVGIALVVGVLLRLVVAVGLFRSLPVYGYDEKAQRAGYVYYDAYARDTDAWARGRSDKPLWASFEDRKASDQYGGLLFLSAAIHRYLSGGAHRPLTVATLAAAVSSLAVLFTWGFTGMVFGRRAGIVAAWVVALYPDFVLLGASQMREAFLVPALAVALYGYARARIGAYRSAAVTLAVGFTLAMLISPPFALLMTALLGVAWIWEGRGQPERAALGLLGAAVVAVVGVALTWQAWSGLQGVSSESLTALALGWLQEGARFQLATLEDGSGWVQSIFARTPGWAHMPLATVYGLTRPFLPAALADNSGLPIWRTIAVARAVGWFAILPFLLYAPFAAVRSTGVRSLATYLTLVVWLAAVLASYRAAGDLWDNPRYRAGTLVMQASVVGWAWVHAARTGSPWLRRTAVLVLAGTLIFLHWYVGRYYGTPRLNLLETLALLAGTVFIWLFGNWWRDRRSAAQFTA